MLFIIFFGFLEYSERLTRLKHVLVTIIIFNFYC